MMIFVMHVCKSQQTQRDTLFAKKLLHKADSLNRNGNYKTSDKIALKAASIFKESEKWALWFEAYNIIFYNGLYSKDLDTSSKLVEKGLPALPTSETYLLGRLHYILGYCYERKGLIFEALPYYEQSLENFKKVKDNYFINQIYGNISQLYIQQGEYQKAITYLKNAIAHGKSTNDTLTIWKNTKSLGDAYLFNGEFKKARKTYQHAQQLIDEKDGTFERYEAEILYKLAAYEKAFIATQKALEITENCKKDVTKNQRYCTANFNTMNVLLGNIYFKLGNTKKALDQYQKSLHFIKEKGNLREIGKVSILIGDTFKALKQHDKALENYQKALQTFIPDFTENEVTENPSQELWILEIWLMEIFKRKGDCFYAKYKDSKSDKWLYLAEENYELAATFTENVRLSFTETASKLKLGSQTNMFYEELIKVKLALFTHTKKPQYKSQAFLISQRANAFVLRGLLNEKQALKVADIPKDSIVLFETYAKDITILKQKVEDSIEIDSSQKLLIDAKEGFQNLKNAISENYPKFDMLRNNLEGVTVQQIQASIDTSTQFIKYFLGSETLYVFSISKEHFFVDQIQLPENFQELIAQYRQSLSDISFINKKYNLAEKQYLQTAHSLYKILLKKPLQNLNNTTDIQKLTIIPDGVLHTIPFQTLLTNKSDSWANLDNAVIKKYAISYHYFCKMLVHKIVDFKHTNGFTSFGLELDEATLRHVQKMTKDSIQNSTINDNLRNMALYKLTFSDDEALQLATLMNGKSWINKEATKTNFIQNASNSSSIHLATHALLDTENPNISALIFTKTTDTISNLLRLDEIYNHNFNANMITLSACNTGFGKYHKGEGLQSLARAFNFSNIPSVTATLWSIPDASSATLMKLYYSYLKQGFSKSVALQKAQLEYVENDEISSPASRLPFYWAAWTHIGANDAITFEQQNNFTYYLLSIPILLLLVVGFLWFKKLRV